MIGTVTEGGVEAERRVEEIRGAEVERGKGGVEAEREGIAEVEAEIGKEEAEAENTTGRKKKVDIEYTAVAPAALIVKVTAEAGVEAEIGKL